MTDHPPSSTLTLKVSLARKEAIMTTIKAFIKRYPLLSYFVLAFAISWGTILLAVGLGPGGLSATPQQLQMAVPYAVPAMLLGPGVAGILLTGLLYGPTVVVGLQTRRGYPSSRYGALARNHSMAPGVLSHPGSASV